MAAERWKAAFLSIWRKAEFALLNELLAEDGRYTGINDAGIDWDGAWLTPLFVAVLIRLDDQVGQLIAAGADPSVQCFYEGIYCCPLHAAAIHSDKVLIDALIDSGCDANVPAEASALDEGRGDLTALNALHVLVVRDQFSEDVYRHLMSRGVQLSVPCRHRDGTEINGLLLPRHLNNAAATEERIDAVLGEELKFIIKSSRLAHSLNDFLERMAVLRRCYETAYRCTTDIDFCLSAQGGQQDLLPGEEEEASTLLLFAAEMGNCEAVRLLLYSGADASRTVQRVVQFDTSRSMSFKAQAVHLALLRADTVMTEQLIFFGENPKISVSGHVHGTASGTETEERWADLSLVHLAVLSRNYHVVPELLKNECSISDPALRSVEGSAATKVPPLHLAVLLEDARCCTKLIDCGAEITEGTREAALQSQRLQEMFGGTSSIGLEEWVTALLTGEDSVQALIDRRTDLSKSFDWPKERGATAVLLEGKPLSSPELIRRLTKTLEGVPTSFQAFKPSHLALLLGQPWALKMLVKEGAEFERPCQEVLSTPDYNLQSQALDRVALNPILLCARAGSLEMLQFLVDEKLCSDVLEGTLQEVALAPDLTPPFYPSQLDTSTAGKVSASAPLPDFAWQKLGPLELALLHGRADIAVLLVRLGADLLHRVDHMAIHPPTHYSITDKCFRGLTPLHICAMLDLKAMAAALLSEASSDSDHFFPGEGRRPQRKELLAATCTQAWATLETRADPGKELWLWKDLTPLHVALICKSYDTAELLAEASTPATLNMLCVRKDIENDDIERSQSALLLAFELNLKDLHRKIAKKFPTC
eukprot:TRINITY_DN23192_c0_g1_i4.p1 TRINITY_DN23192_c0_g1~~TRINITY_DN23192_c0_g1_i4.p1  ORF type:complete len:820 (+),score=124.61 TRINITY_DN23192_c0_g1_i4:89-2548(+)